MFHVCHQPRHAPQKDPHDKFIIFGRQGEETKGGKCGSSNLVIVLKQKKAESPQNHLLE
jgi:hypothetical protein